VGYTLINTRRSSRQGLRFVAITIVLMVISPSFIFSQTASPKAEPPSFESLARQATAAREQGKSEEAIRYYQQALQIHPEWEEGWWYVGTLLYDANRFAEATPAFAKVVQLDPQMGPAWSFLGLCGFENKDYPAALLNLDRGHELGSAQVPEIAKVAGYHLALLLIRNSDFDRAIDLLSSELVRGQVTEQVKVALGLAILRVPLLPDAVDPSKDGLVATAGGIGALLAQNQQDQALQAFPQALNEYPDAPNLHYAFGSALAAAGRMDEAQVQLREEMKISPQSALPYQALAAIQLQLHRPQQALKLAEEAVKLAPHSASAYKVLAASLQAVGRPDDAASALSKAAGLGPEEPQEGERTARLYERGALAPKPGTGATGGSAAGFDELARKAAAARDSGNIEEAIRDYQGALKLRPAWEGGWWDLSLVYFSNARYADSIDPLKRVVDLKPEYGTAWAMLGLSEYQTKDYKNALIHLEKAQGMGIQGSPDAIRLAQYHLGALLNQNREFERSVELLSGGHPEGQLATLWNLALGMGLLRVPLLPEQVDPAQQPLLRAAGQAASLLANSKYDDAFIILQNILKDYPATPFLHYAYGSALASLSQYDEAEAQLREEMRISPNSALPLIRLAFVDLKTQRPGDALTAAQRAVQLAPQSPEAHYILGRALLSSGETKQAIQELETANEMMPSSPEIHFHLARAYSKDKQPDKASQEREIFARLNAIAEHQRSTRGSQAYGASHEQQSDLSLPPVVASPDAASEPR
jgi:tetratricopeptide (TPR) repeat protein